MVRAKEADACSRPNADLLEAAAERPDAAIQLAVGDTATVRDDRRLRFEQRRCATQRPRSITDGSQHFQGR